MDEHKPAKRDPTGVALRVAGRSVVPMKWALVPLDEALGRLRLNPCDVFVGVLVSAGVNKPKEIGG